LRLLRRNPETSVVAILAMAVAIGIAGTMFSVVNAILIQPLPFKQPDRLVAIWQIDPLNASMWRPAAPGNYSDTLGVPPILGRTFSAEEDRPGSRAVVVLSYDLWQRGFGGERNVLGRTA